MSSKDKELVPDLIRNTINKLNNTIHQKNDYIKVLENKVQELETENYWFRKNANIDKDDEIQIEIIDESGNPTTEEVVDTTNVEEGLKNMGLDTPEAIEELSDLLDEVFKKQDDDADEG